MLNIRSQKRSWPYALAIWWNRFQARWEAFFYPHRAVRPNPFSDLTDRRFPIPVSQAHRFARAADEAYYRR